MKTAILRNGERYFGVDIAPEGIVVVERADGRSLGATRYPAGAEGIAAVCGHIEKQGAHPHVCIRACGAAAMTLATALMAVEGIEVTMVKEPGARAERLARLAERLF
jgi:hypothetical protein